MNDEGLRTIEEVKRFLGGSQSLEFGGISADERYLWIEVVLTRYKYSQLNRADKGVIRRYIEKLSGYCRAQVSRLIKCYNQWGQLRKANYKRHQFPRKYTPADIALLARTDELHDCLSGPATKKILDVVVQRKCHPQCSEILSPPIDMFSEFSPPGMIWGWLSINSWFCAYWWGKKVCSERSRLA